MSPEDTDLERRVLAHEQILQALLAELGERDPRLLKSITERFSPSRLGAHDQDFRETADYAEAFVHAVRQLHVGAPILRTSPDRKGAPEEAFDRQPLSRSDGLIHIAGARRSGIWHVTQDGRFVGDYLKPEPALRAAMDLAREVERRGGEADVSFDGVSVVVPRPGDDGDPARSPHRESRHASRPRA